MGLRAGVSHADAESVTDDVALRTATVDDIPLIAQVMYDSMCAAVGRGLFDQSLLETRTSPLRFHEALLIAGANNWGQLNSFLVIEGAQGTLGAMGAFRSDMEDLRPLTADGLRKAADVLGWSQAKSRAFWSRYVAFFGPFGQSPQLKHAATYVLEYGAIRKDARGKGLYQRLFAGHAARARLLAHDAMGGSAVIGNTAVVRSLELFGFKEAYRLEAATYRNQYPGMIRYRYDLGDA